MMFVDLKDKFASQESTTKIKWHLIIFTTNLLIVKTCLNTKFKRDQKVINLCPLNTVKKKRQKIIIILK